MTLRAWVGLMAAAVALASAGMAQAGVVILKGTGSGSLRANGTTKIDILDPDNNAVINTAEWGTAPTIVGEPSANSGYNNYSGEHWGRVFDNNTGSKVCCGFNPGITSLTVKSATTKYSLTGYTISTGNDDHGRRPDGWRVFGSTDGFAASNVLIDTVVRADINGGTGFNNNEQVGEVTLAGPTTPFNSFRIVFDDSDVPNNFQISEVEFLGTLTSLAVGGAGTIGTTNLTPVSTVTAMTDNVANVKKITLTQNLTETIQVAELEAYQHGTGINVALQSNGGVATASTWGYDTVPGNANNGNLAGNHPNEWHSTDGQGAWLAITLASPSALSSLKFYGRTDCCQFRQDDFTVNLLDESNQVLFTKRVTGMGNTPGATILLGVPLTGEDVATLIPQGEYNFEVNALTGAVDVLAVPRTSSIYTTKLNLNGAILNLTALNGTLGEGLVLDLLNADQIYGTFGQINLPGDRLSWDLSQLYTTGQITAVPEPATMALLAFGLTSVGGYLRRRTNKA